MSKVFGRIKGLGLSSLAAVLLLQPLFFLPINRLYADEVPQIDLFQINTSTRGNITNKLSLYHVDQQKPIVNGEVTVSADITNVVKYKVERSGPVSETLKQVGPEENLTQASFSFNTISDNYVEGEHHFVLDVESSNQITNNRSITFIVDKTQPIISNYLADKVSNTINVTADFYDELGLFEVGYKLNDVKVSNCVVKASLGLLADNPANGSRDCVIDTNFLQNGTYTLKAYAEDKAGNIAEVIIDSNINVNNSPDAVKPEITILSGIPANGIIDKYTLVRIAVSDEGGLAYTSLSYYNNNYPEPFTYCESVEPATYRLMECYLSPFLIPGDFTLKVYARDVAGNESIVERPIKLVWVMNYDFQLISPISGSVFNTPINIEGRIKDSEWNGIVNLYYNNGGEDVYISTLTDFANTSSDIYYNHDHLRFDYIWTPSTNGKYDIIAKFVTFGEESSTIEDKIIEITFTGAEEPSEDTTAPIFVTKDVTRDEGESFPSLNEFVLSNPENLEVFCSSVDASEMFVSQPASNKLIPVTCYVEDAAGNRTTSTSNLIVNNVLPKVVIIANPSIVVTEGTTVNLIANILNGNAGFTYNWYGSCSGNGTNPSVGLTNFSNVPSNTGSYLCGISVTDADGDVASASVRVDVLAQGANSSTPSNPTTDSNTENTNTTDNTNSNDSEVQGVYTENPVSAPSEEQNTGSTNNTNTTAVNSVVTTSPLVIICLVAGAILIIGLLLFLFFRGDDSEQTNETASA